MYRYRTVTSVYCYTPNTEHLVYKTFLILSYDFWIELHNTMVFSWLIIQNMVRYYLVLLC